MKEALRYILNGGATTAVNYVVYIILLHLNWNYMAANTAAWVFAVLFAYMTNRMFVFRSRNDVGRELFSFVSLRFLTLLLENLLLFLCIQQLSLHPLVSKLAVSAVTVVANYVICKCQIFRNAKKGGSLNE